MEHHLLRRPRSAILPHFDPPKEEDVRKIMVFRSIILEKQAANMKARNSALELFEVGQNVRIQNRKKTFTWSREGQVLDRRDHGKSYTVLPNDGTK